MVSRLPKVDKRLLDNFDPIRVEIGDKYGITIRIYGRMQGP